MYCTGRRSWQGTGSCIIYMFTCHSSHRLHHADPMSPLPGSVHVSGWMCPDACVFNGGCYGYNHKLEHHHGKSM